MKIELAVTRTCHHCPILEAELKNMGIPYPVRYVEDDPDLQARYRIKGSPNILVDDELVFRGMPELSELRAYFRKND
jgi:predicted thioredoxin/glutaredoxin